MADSSSTATSALDEATSLFVEGVKAVKTAVEIHGETAVNTALLVYRLESIQYVVSSVVIFSISLFIFVWCFRVMREVICKLIEHPSTKEEEIVPRMLLSSIFGFISLSILGVTFINLMNVFHWASALGWPEIMVAKRALEAAGLM